MCINVYIHMYVYTCVYIYICINININIMNTTCSDLPPPPRCRKESWLERPETNQKPLSNTGSLMIFK